MQADTQAAALTCLNMWMTGHLRARPMWGKQVPGAARATAAAGDACWWAQQCEQNRSSEPASRAEAAARRRPAGRPAQGWHPPLQRHRGRAVTPAAAGSPAAARWEPAAGTRLKARSRRGWAAAAAAGRLRLRRAGSRAAALAAAGTLAPAAAKARRPCPLPVPLLRGGRRLRDRDRSNGRLLGICRHQRLCRAGRTGLKHAG